VNGTHRFIRAIFADNKHLSFLASSFRKANFSTIGYQKILFKLNDSKKK